MFNVGDLLIYPTQGLAEVQGIESKSIGGSSVEFYILRIMSKNLAIMVPVANEEKIGLRKLIRADDLPKVERILKSDSDMHYTQWHHRYSDNFEKLKSGSIFQTAEVVRDLFTLKKRKNLAIKESRMMDNALQLLVTEVASCMNVSDDKASEWINSALN